MSVYKKYKNGIIGSRYRGYYIIKGEKKGQYQILTGDKKVYRSNLYTFEECKWVILVNTVSQEELDLIMNLCAKEIYELNGIFLKLIQKKEKEGLNEQEKKLYEYVDVVSSRKVEIARRKIKSNK